MSIRILRVRFEIVMVSHRCEHSLKSKRQTVKRAYLFDRFFFFEEIFVFVFNKTAIILNYRIFSLSLYLHSLSSE